MIFMPLFQCLMSIIMLSSNDIYALINYASFVESSFIGVSIAGMLYLRYKQPNRERPIKVRNIFYPQKILKIGSLCAQSTG